MTMYVTAGGKNNGTKKLRSRFGGESAWKQHAGDDRVLTAVYKARCAELAGQAAVAELELGVDDEGYAPVSTTGWVAICQCSGRPRPTDGCVEVDGVTLVYRGGKLIAAHCG